jgi:DNA polymerase-3 subunit gamma/tau
MLTDPAFNALLKTLEEPPPHVLFVLATTEVHRVPATIASRCQRFDFRRIPSDAIVQRLSFISKQEELAIGDEGLRLIAHAASGSLRDAENLLEQAITVFGPAPALDDVRALLGLTGDARVRQLTSQLVNRDLAAALETLQSVEASGLDLRQFQRELVEWLRALLLVKAGASQVSSVSAEELSELRALARQISIEEASRSLQLFASADLRADAYSPLPLEIALVQSLAVDRALNASPDPLPRSDERQGTPQRPSPRQPRSGQPNATPIQEAPVGSRGPAQVRPPVPSRELPPNLTAPSAPRPSVVNPAPLPDDTPARRLDALRRSFLTEVRQRDPKAAALLNSKWQPQDDGEGALLLVFPYEFHKKELESSSQHLRAVEDATRAILGAPFRIRCSFVPQATAAPSASESVTGANVAPIEAHENPVVRAALEEGARLLDTL